MTAPTTVDLLPPQSRFALRAVAAGLTLDDAAQVLHVDGVTLRKHLRAALRSLGSAATSPSEGDDALLAALSPALVAARAPSARAPSTRCPDADVAAMLAAGRLDGPLVLAEAEHVADCPSCLARLVALRRAGNTPRRTLPARRPLWSLLVGAAAGLAAAVWWLFG